MSGDGHIYILIIFNGYAVCSTSNIRFREGITSLNDRVTAQRLALFQGSLQFVIESLLSVSTMLVNNLSNRAITWNNSFHSLKSVQETSLVVRDSHCFGGQRQSLYTLLAPIFLYLGCIALLFSYLYI